jgi:hypothetical protein
MSKELLLSVPAINRASALSKIQKISVVLWFLWLKTIPCNLWFKPLPFHVADR